MNHDYAFSLGGKEMEKGRKKNLHTLKFSTMMPIVKSKRVSLYAHLQYDSYLFDTDNEASSPSVIFGQNHHNYYAGGFNGSYYMNLFGKPFILSATVTADAWGKGMGQVMGTASGIMVIKRTKRTTFNAGMMFMTHFNKIPMMPIISFWHHFSNPNLSIDVTLPNQLYLRYQMKKQRISVGHTLSVDNFYMRTNLDNTPHTVYYSHVSIKPEILYEYILNKRFYLSARAGVAVSVDESVYKKNRKDLKIRYNNGAGGLVAKKNRSPIPFVNVGISYSLFK